MGIVEPSGLFIDGQWTVRPTRMVSDREIGSEFLCTALNAITFVQACVL
jgi:hypothetical protein